MSSPMEKFNKIITIFKAKYKKMEVSQFISFLKDRIDLPDDSISNIQSYVLRSKKRSDKFNDEELELYFHLIAAAYAKIDFRTKDEQSLKAYVQMGKFKSNKSKESKDMSEQKQSSKDIVKVQKQIKKEVKSNQVSTVENKSQFKQKLNNIKAVSSQPQTTPEILLYPSFSINAENKVQISSKEIKPAKQVSFRSPKKLQRQQQIMLTTIEEDVIDENRVSGLGSTQLRKTEQFLLKYPEIEMMAVETKKHANITGFDKFGQSFLAPIIKYRIVYDDKVVYRRFSQFQNLMNYLDKEYQGFILPQLPPKEGIKHNFQYFLGLDQNFLNERQIKLEQMLNALLNSKFVSQDEVLNKFLKDQQYQVEQNIEGSAVGYLQSIRSIAFNANQLKNYGLAYYNYFKDFKKSEIVSVVTAKYKQIDNLLNFCLAIDHYRSSINNNFQKRREIFQELGLDSQSRQLTITDFDKLSSSTATEIRNLKLKSQQSWLNYLVSQKQRQSESNVDQHRKERETIIHRIRRMEDNLIISIQTLKTEKEEQLKQIGQQMVEWRKKIHP